MAGSRVKPLRSVALMLLAAMLLCSTRVWAGEYQPEADIRQLLGEFLAGASVNNVAMHDRFWHPDLIYTSSAGSRFGKAAIMQGLAGAETDDAVATPRYWAENVHMRQLGETVVLTFKLMAETTEPGSGQARQPQYFNTGVLVQNQSQWQAITWQATRIGDGE